MTLSGFLGLRPLCGAVALAGVLLTPAAAAAEGPGYGGTADAMTVQWQTEPSSTEGLTVDAAGFRADSPVVLRVGSAADQTAVADAIGTLHLLVVSAADAVRVRPAAGLTVVQLAAATGRFSTGLSVQAVGHDPAGGIRTLVGSVPPRAAGNHVLDAAPWVALGAVLVGWGLIVRRRHGSKR